MKKFLFVITALIVIPTVFILSCKKDKDETPIPTNTTTYSISVSGTVYQDNVNLYPLSGVDVSIGSVTTQTDANGMFYFSNVSVPKDRFVIEFTKTGYFTLSRSAIPTSGAKIEMEAGLISETDPTYSATTTFSAPVGGTLTFPGVNGCTVSFPANALVTSSLVLYTGMVTVKAAYLDPTIVNYGLFAFGGDLHGKDSTGASVMLNPFTGLNVVITDASGAALQLDEANSKKATVGMEIPLGLINDAPATIELLEYEKTSGICTASGSASKSGGRYMGQVGHFSYWSCQKTTVGEATISGTVLSATGHPVAGVRLRVGRQLGVGSTNSDLTTVTDMDGNYSFVIPAGVAGRVTLVPTFFTCSSANPVNFTALNNGESFTADFTLSSLRKVTGRLVNCLGNPVSGRVVLNFTSLLGSQVHTSCYTNSTGVFYLPMEIGTTYGTINAYGNSTDTLKYIYPSSIDTLVDVGDIYLCIPATPGINSLTLFGGPYTSSTTVSTFDGTRTGYKFTGTSGTHTLINAYGSMGEFSMGITGTALNVNYPIGAKSVTWVNIYLYSPTFFSDTMSSGTVKITKFGPVGGLIEGTFSGVTGQGVQITNGKFSVIRTPDQP